MMKRGSSKIMAQVERIVKGVTFLGVCLTVKRYFKNLPRTPNLLLLILETEYGSRSRL